MFVCNTYFLNACISCNIIVLSDFIEENFHLFTSPTTPNYQFSTNYAILFVRLKKKKILIERFEKLQLHITEPKQKQFFFDAP